ncbi:MAG TPA: hypothetical protein V6C99_02860 [Oculatellaceae cyanobacterium]|jgi:hypothetical protein
MPITFDTLAELKAFYRDFALVESSRSGRKSSAGVLTEPEENEELPRRRRGRPPGKKSEKAKSKAVTAQKKGTRSRAAQGETLTSKIQASIQSFLDAGRSFTANDVYDDLSKKDSSVNKQSVITSVLKQMNSTFQHVAVTERPGNGPRPVKLYNP